MATETYTGLHYYFINEGQHRTLIATYDEAEASHVPETSPYAWFKPYEERALEISPDAIRKEIAIQVAPDITYYHVDLSTRFLEDNTISMLPPEGKWPDTMAGWAPYGGRQSFWECVRLFSGGSRIGQAIAEIRSNVDCNGPIADTLEPFRLMDSQGSKSDKLVYFEEICGLLRPLLHPIDGDQALVGAIDRAMPPQLPPPKRENGDYPQCGDNSDRVAWQWRLLYALTYGLAMGQL